MLKQQNKKIYILGTDKIGWSIDKDRMYTIKAIEMLDGTLAEMESWGFDHFNKSEERI